MLIVFMKMNCDKKSNYMQWQVRFDMVYCSKIYGMSTFTYKPVFEFLNEKTYYLEMICFEFSVAFNPSANIQVLFQTTVQFVYFCSYMNSM